MPGRLRPPYCVPPVLFASRGELLAEDTAALDLGDGQVVPLDVVPAVHLAGAVPVGIMVRIAEVRPLGVRDVQALAGPDAPPRPLVEGHEHLGGETVRRRHDGLGNDAGHPLDLDFVPPEDRPAVPLDDLVPLALPVHDPPRVDPLGELLSAEQVVLGLVVALSLRRRALVLDLDAEVRPVLLHDAAHRVNHHRVVPVGHPDEDPLPPSSDPTRATDRRSRGARRRRRGGSVAPGRS